MQGEEGNVHWSIMKELPANDPRIPVNLQTFVTCAAAIG